MVVWNIEGINNTLWDADFILYLETFDIFGLIETWDQSCDKELKNRFPDYHSFSCAATKKANHVRAMGAFMSLLKQYIKILYKN